MSDARRFLGGAAFGLLLAVAVVTAINLGTGSVGPTPVQTVAKTVMASDTSTTSTAPPSVSSEAAGYANLAANTSGASSTTSSQSSSSAQPSQPDNSPHDVSTSSGTSVASLIQTLPAVAIALVLGILVYQFSVRRVETG